MKSWNRKIDITGSKLNARLAKSCEFLKSLYGSFLPSGHALRDSLGNISCHTFTLHNSGTVLSESSFTILELLL